MQFLEGNLAVPIQNLKNSLPFDSEEHKCLSGLLCATCNLEFPEILRIESVGRNFFPLLFYPEKIKLGREGLSRLQVETT